MWMQQSVETSHIGNVHQRNRFGGPGNNSNPNGGGFDGSARPNYMGAPSTAQGNDGDWKAKILEGGQWLGGKVIEYGAKIARGNAGHEPMDRMSQGPRNDGRANWMADIRNSSGSFGVGGSYGGGNGNTYQNDFAVERPMAYTDYGRNSNSQMQSRESMNQTLSPYGGGYGRPDEKRTPHHHHSKKEKDKKKSKSKKSKSRREEAESESESASESETSDVASVSGSGSGSEAADSDSGSDSGSRHGRHARKSKSKAKSKGKDKGHKKSKHKDSLSVSSEEEDSGLEDKSKSKSKAKLPATRPERASSDYTFSLDTSKIPPPPEERKESRKSPKAGSKTKTKKSSKSRSRKQSMQSTESELSDNEEINQVSKKVSKTKSKSKTRAVSNQDSVDLLGVGFHDVGALPAATTATSSATVQQLQVVQPSVFDQLPQPLDPLQDLAGLNFSAGIGSTQSATPTPIGFPTTAPVASTEPVASSDMTANMAVQKMLPDNNIVDLDALASNKTKRERTASSDKTLAELQRDMHKEQKPVMAIPLASVNAAMGGPMPTTANMVMGGGVPMNPMQMQMHLHMQMNQMNQTGPMSQINQMNQMNPMNVMMQQMQLQQQQQPQQQHQRQPVAVPDPFEGIFAGDAATTSMPLNQPIESSFP